MSGATADPSLEDLEKRLAGLSLRGQWMADANRPQNIRKGANGAVHIEPVPAGRAHVWRWSDIAPILQYACEAMPESYTARRALILHNPGLPRGTTHTMLSSIQIVKPGEIAWAHRHTINALRFSIQGGPKTYTIVEGRKLSMEPYDLLLTPGWTWHDHHNESDQDAIWMDGLDVPFTLALNQNFYDELGEIAQKPGPADSLAPLMFRPGPCQQASEMRPYRYPWADTLRTIEAREGEPVDPLNGRLIEFINPRTGGSVLPTLRCRVQILPPGFEGRLQRHTSSTMAFVISGEGSVRFDAGEIAFGKHDSFALPNWTQHRFVNASKREPVILFTMDDSPILSAFGYYRLESEDSAAASQSATGAIRPAAE